MERLVGTVSRGIRAPIIREGDDISKIVVDSVLSAAESSGFQIHDQDIMYVYGATILQVDDEVLLMRSSDGQTYYLLERMVELP